MFMNLGGVIQDLPMYDQQGNLVYDPENNQDAFDSEIAVKLVDLVRSELGKIDDIGTNLTCSDEVNVYDAFDSNCTDNEYYSVTLSGGMNGSGLWSNYLKVLSELVLHMEAAFENVWVRNFDIDCVDDVFNVELGIMPYATQLD